MAQDTSQTEKWELEISQEPPDLPHSTEVAAALLLFGGPERALGKTIERVKAGADRARGASYVRHICEISGFDPCDPANLDLFLQLAVLGLVPDTVTAQELIDATSTSPVESHQLPLVG